jgi:hypothetical protein
VQHISILVCCFLILADLNFFLSWKDLLIKFSSTGNQWFCFKFFLKTQSKIYSSFGFGEEVSLKMMVELDILSY